MVHKTALLTLTAPSRAAGAQIFLQSWTPEGTPRGVLLLSHGYAEHAGRYDHFAQRCVSAGLAVCAIDHWGHGRSDGDRGFVPDFSVFLDGMEVLLAHVRSTYPDTPRVLVGHSMGGLIAAVHLLTHQDAYAAAILSGPAVKPGAPPSVVTRLIGRLLSAIAPHAGLIQLDAQGVSRDPQVVARYLADPLVYKGKMTARLAAEMLTAMELSLAKASDIHLPLLVVHGSADSLAAPEGGRELTQKASSPCKEFRLFEGLYHEVFNEPEREDVIDGVLAWIDARLI